MSLSVSPYARRRIREMAADLKAAEATPREKFSGEKSIYCANLAACLGRYAIPLLDALEALEARGPTGLERLPSETSLRAELHGDV